MNYLDLASSPSPVGTPLDHIHDVCVVLIVGNDEHWQLFYSFLTFSIYIFGIKLSYMSIVLVFINSYFHTGIHTYI